MIHLSIVNIEGERVPFVDQDDNDSAKVNNGKRSTSFNKRIWGIDAILTNSTIGRFPSQLFVDDMAAQVIDEQTGLVKNGRTFYPVNKIPGSILYYSNKDNKLYYNKTFKGDSAGGSKILHRCSYSDYELQEITSGFEMYKKII